MTIFIHIRYWGAFIIILIGSALTFPGEMLIKLGRWIGSRSKNDARDD